MIKKTCHYCQKNLGNRYIWIPGETYMESGKEFCSDECFRKWLWGERRKEDEV